MIILKEFLYSNAFVALTTFVVGSFAIGIYITQKREYKRSMAQLIGQEIRYAEQQIINSRIIAQDKYYLAHQLLPTNHWYTNINLFMRDFEESKIDRVSRFYSQVEYLDRLIKKISDFKTDIMKETVIINEKIISQENMILVTELHKIKNLLASKSQIEQDKIIQNDKQTKPQHVKIVSGLMAESILKEVSNKIEFIYNTPIGEQFRDLARKKWYQIL